MNKKNTKVFSWIYGSYKKFIPIIIGGLFGVVIGWLLSGIFGATIVTKIFGALLIILGVREMFIKR